MNLEQPKEEFFHERTTEELRLHNLIQVELMKRYARMQRLSNHDAALEWTDKRHFSKTFSDIVKEHPELYEQYSKDPEATLSKIEAILYGSESLEQAA
ncbi:MAG: hypothetical protein A3C06_01920 [Candidatus Taylorbacteria bacterium RIFCSPHIGHO2_02_FULL_46_13]|uniref:Uncharacterized protein n=1 Tax=Candidatus Taylorbacteria bacterium RIFCSPHIGHO2_02_FULL_46_13 TaxID=1802312 RepID=A0A1G2MSI4_9BACT|nr:MAG: hypothetical protein A3C06_01920 [Candidatus Taylorbacteria bacterium RIFCSPHIGHO2_02_FULL_46_13]